MNIESEIPVTTVYADEASGGMVVPPTSTQFHTGVEPNMTAPAPWWNYFMKLFTETNIGAKKDILDILSELNNTLSFFGVTPNPAEHNQFATGFEDYLLSMKNSLLAVDAMRFAYDLVIDSNDKLTQWATSGTYKKVLIEAGSWSSAAAGVDLTARGTKLVVGAPDSKITFTNALKGLYYTSLPITNDYHIEGVSLEVTNASGDGASGFRNCINLTRCTATAVSPGSIGGTKGFYGCKKLIECIGSGNNTNIAADGDGFFLCNDLTSCTGTGTATAGGSGKGNGFSLCENLKGCTGSSTGAGSGFSNCHGFDFNCSGTSNNKENVHRKYFSGTTSATQGTSTYVTDSSIPYSRVRSAAGIIVYGPGLAIAVGAPQATFQSQFEGDTVGLRLNNVAGSSANILSKPCFVTVEYWE